MAIASDSPNQERAPGDPTAKLSDIERSIDQGRYRLGAWDAFLAEARKQSDSERAEITEDVSRVSRKLHLRGGRQTISFAAGVIAEVIATVIGGILLSAGAAGSIVAAVFGAALWTMTFQPLLKIATGILLGVGYEYAYLLRLEPRFKMRYGEYLAMPRWRRVALHLAGTIGSPLGLYLAARIVQPSLPWTATVFLAVLWLIVVINLLPMIGALSGIRRVGSVRLAEGSGGSAGFEIREALTK